MGGTASSASVAGDGKENALGSGHAESEGDEGDDGPAGTGSSSSCFSCCRRGQRDDDTETSCQESIIIYQEEPLYRVWELIVILSCIASSYMYMYLAAFSVPEPGSTFYILDYFILTPIFGIDIIVQFLLDFKPEDSYTRVRDIFEIAKRYLRNQFLFDFIPMLPLHLFTTHPRRKLFYMVKVIRIQKGRNLFSSNSFMRFVKDMFQWRLERYVLTDPELAED